MCCPSPIVNGIAESRSRDADVKAKPRSFPRSLTETLTCIDVVSQDDDAVQESIFVSLGNKKTVLTAGDHLRRGADGACNDRQAGPHRFHHRDWPSLS